MVKSLLRGIQNVIAWLPIIWRDRNFDWAYLIEIMAFKARRMAKCFEEDGVSANSVASVELREWAAAMERYAEGNYHSVAMEEMEFEEAFGKISMEFEPVGNGLQKYVGRSYSKVDNANEKMMANIFYDVAMAVAEKRREDDRRFIIETFSNFDNWWD